MLPFQIQESMIKAITVERIECNAQILMMVTKIQFHNNIIKIHQVMLQPQHSGFKTHNRSKTTAVPLDSNTQNSTSEQITNHIKQFLIPNTTIDKNQLRPHTADQSNRVNISNSMKKSSIYRKLLHKSIDNNQIQQNLANFKKKFSNAKKSETNNQSSLVFRQIWQEDQKSKFNQRIQRKLQGMIMNIQIKQKEQNKPQIKSFQSFLQIKKKKDKFKNKLNESDIKDKSTLSCWQKETITEANLTIEGNQKQLKKKQGIPLTNKSKVRKLFKEISLDKDKETINPQAQLKSSSKLSLQKTRKEQSPTKTLNLQQGKTQKQRKNLNNTNYCFKNIYSPFNGIQIKYLSTDNPDLFPATSGFKEISSKKIIQSYPNPHNRVAKKKESQDNITKGIIFRQKQPSKRAQQIQIQGWKVSHQKPDDYFDLCTHV